MVYLSSSLAFLLPIRYFAAVEEDHDHAEDQVQTEHGEEHGMMTNTVMNTVMKRRIAFILNDGTATTMPALWWKR